MKYKVYFMMPDGVGNPTSVILYNVFMVCIEGNLLIFKADISEGGIDGFYDSSSFTPPDKLVKEVTFIVSNVLCYFPVE